MTQADAATRIIRYEIATRRDGRWTIECAREHQSEAVALARTLLASKAYDAVRVMRERDLRGTTIVQTPVYEALRSGNGALPLRVSASDERDCWCAELDDLYGARSRRAIGQLLRSFLDQLKITPTEILHNIRYARKLDDAGMLLSAAMHRMARARADSTGESLGVSLRFLETLVASAIRRVVDAKAQRHALRPGADGLDPLIARVQEMTENPSDQRFLLRHAIALDFEMLPSLLARLAAALEWGARATTSEALIVVDELVADCLGSATIVQEMLGAQPDLATALRMNIDLARGNFQGTPPRAASWFPALAALLAAHPCPETRTILLVRAQRELGSERPLTRGGPADEATAIMTLANGLRDDVGGTYVGGSAMVEVMVRRWKRLDQPGGFADLEMPVGSAAQRFQTLLVQEPDHYGETKKRAIATLLVDAVREMPLDGRTLLRETAGAIRNAALPEQARQTLLRELALDS